MKNLPYSKFTILKIHLTQNSSYPNFIKPRIHHNQNSSELGLCKLKNGILKKSKNGEKSHFSIKKCHF